MREYTTPAALIIAVLVIAFFAGMVSVVGLSSACFYDEFEDNSAVIQCREFIVVRDAETGEWR